MYFYRQLLTCFDLIDISFSSANSSYSINLFSPLLTIYFQKRPPSSVFTSKSNPTPSASASNADGALETAPLLKKFPYQELYTQTVQWPLILQ